MADYSTLKAAIADVVKTNGSQAITGANLQSVLLSIINSIGGGGYIFAGVATPSTSVGTPDQNVFYITGAGTFANMGTSTTIPQGAIGVFKYNGSWTSSQILLFDGLTDVPTDGSTGVVSSGGLFKEIEPLKSTVLSRLKVGRGGLNTSTGDEVNNADGMSRRARTSFLKTPFNLSIQSGNRIGAVLKYDKNGTFISNKGYRSSAPFTTEIRYPADNYLYRVLFTRESASTNFTDDEIANMVVSFDGAFDIKTEGLSHGHSLIPLFGTVSIIGDSISTFYGEMPSGYAAYYPERGVNFSVQTWWRKLIEQCSLTLLVNASDSGSRVTDTVSNPTFYDRVNAIGSPDNIIVEVGTNDAYYSVNLGEYDFTSPIEELSLSTFRTAYIKGVKALMESHPSSKIVLLIMSMGQQGSQYAESIKTIGKYYNLDVIECDGYYRTDNSNVHPSATGMDMIVQSIYSFYADKDGRYILDSAKSLCSDYNSDLYIERGGLSTSTGADVNSNDGFAKRVRTSFLRAPFEIEVNAGYRIGALIGYDKTDKSFISSAVYSTTAPFVTKIKITKENRLYRVLFTKDDSTSNFTYDDFNSFIKGFTGKFDSIRTQIEEEGKLFESRNSYILHDTVINYYGTTITINTNADWDIIVVNVPSGAGGIKVSDYSLARLYCFDSNAVNDFTVEHWIGVIPYVADTFMYVPSGTAVIAILVQKSYYPNGYGDIQIDFQQQGISLIPQSYTYTGEVIDLAKRWNIDLYKSLGTVKTIQSMAHYGDRLFALCNSNDKVQIYVYNLTSGALIQSFDDVDTGGLLGVHCNVTFFGNEFYTGNDSYPLLYTSQWSGNRALLAYNIEENEARDTYTVSLVQTITPSSSISTDDIGSGYMDYMYDQLSGKLVSISYDVASQGYYDTENDAHVTFFDMPLISAGSSVQLTSVLDSFRIAPIPVRQDMTVYNGKLYLFSGFGNAEWKAYLNVIDLVNKRVNNKILVSDAYGTIFGEPEGVDIIDDYLIVTSTSDKSRLNRMNFL